MAYYYPAYARPLSKKVSIAGCSQFRGVQDITSMRGVTMHLKMTAARHVVNFINYRNYDKKTGLKGSLTKHFSLGILSSKVELYF
jgi:hypothetical protein